jgi:hypothetical protein
MQHIRSLVTPDTYEIGSAVERTLKDNSTAIDAVYVVTQGDTVMLGEFPKGVAGSSTLFQVDFGIVSWNGIPDFLERAKGIFLTRFDVKQGSPILYPVMAEQHDSFNGVPKLLIYFGVALDGAMIVPVPDIEFCNINWASRKAGKSWHENLGRHRTPEKKDWHVEAINKTFDFQGNIVALVAA